jgi:hypothetical protein
MGEGEQESIPIHATEYVAPAVERPAFHCPYCRVYAEQTWVQLVRNIRGHVTVTALYEGKCKNCKKLTL